MIFFGEKKAYAIIIGNKTGMIMDVIWLNGRQVVSFYGCNLRIKARAFMSIMGRVNGPQIPHA